MCAALRADIRQSASARGDEIADLLVSYWFSRKKSLMNRVIKTVVTTLAVGGVSAGVLAGGVAASAMSPASSPRVPGASPKARVLPEACGREKVEVLNDSPYPLTLRFAGSALPHEKGKDPVAPGWIVAPPAAITPHGNGSWTSLNCGTAVYTLGGTTRSHNRGPWTVQFMADPRKGGSSTIVYDDMAPDAGKFPIKADVVRSLDGSKSEFSLTAKKTR
jgi:hypothetical protein